MSDLQCSRVRLSYCLRFLLAVRTTSGYCSCLRGKKCLNARDSEKRVQDLVFTKGIDYIDSAH